MGKRKKVKIPVWKIIMEAKRVIPGVVSEWEGALEDSIVTDDEAERLGSVTGAAVAAIVAKVVKKECVNG